jgi:hypothetical protein
MSITTIELTSDWPTATYTGYTHSLINMAEDVLLAKSITNLARTTRDPELLEMWLMELQSALKTLLDSDLVFSLEDLW